MPTIDDSMLHSSPWKRPASAEAWESVKASGWATKALRVVYQVLYEGGPLTLRELDRDASVAAGVPTKAYTAKDVSRGSTFVRRLYDLRAHGLVSAIGQTRVCTVSNKEEPLYDVTSNACPEEKLKPITKDALRKRVASLELLVGQLLKIRKGCPTCALTPVSGLPPSAAPASTEA